MTLAFAIFRYFPFGGLQRDMLAIAQAAVERGHQVSIFCGDWQGEKISGIDVIEIKSSGFFNVAGVKNFVTAFQQQYQREQFDLLVGFNKMPGLDVYFAGDSCFAHKAYRERNWLYRLSPRARLYLAYERAVFAESSTTHILSLVASEQQQFARYHATQPERFHTLPPGISAAHLACANPSAARVALCHELGLSRDTKIILCLGSGYKTKGVDISINAFAELTQMTTDKIALVIVGKDDPHAYRQQAMQAGIEQCVFFLGPRSPVGDLLHAADVLLHPARKELAGNVILEAMLCGCPVVASEHCGYAHYIVEQQLGQLIPANTSPLVIAQQLAETFAVEKQAWRVAAENFAQTSDVFSRPAVAVAALEKIATAKRNVLADFSCVQTPAGHDVILRDELIDSWKGQDVFSLMENMQGTIAREMKDRQTLRFEINGRGYYRKWHRGVGWSEVIKNLLQLRLPVLGASNEWHALNKLRALNIPSLIPVAYGVRGKNPARQQSFVVTRELTDVIQLDHFFEQYSVGIKAKRRILACLARIARELHAAGINHRDFYLCHFMLKTTFIADQDQAPEIYLVDLHRAQLRPRVPERWLIKDLGGLLFSSLNLRFSQRDYCYFMRIYFAQNLRAVFTQQKTRLGKIAVRACTTYRRDFGHDPLLFAQRN
ncbi:lipopolysaccharide core heptose(I) kinase RfaP [Cellvibrio sp. OA-2007]|uniref:lipopolysaccharide core heptose(I) kinase RfaP n=1 Tax=Cellvibrio sp. OA-2007 TaxID=529823 RepID=UPI000780C759|nr:lipopolysaccharide core heptose(I) kinase RfaP [Cellvibrio sp. OA-2007]